MIGTIGWWHPKAEYDVRPNHRDQKVEIHCTRPARRDLQTGICISLLPDEAKRIATAIIQAVDGLDTDAQTIP